MRVYVEVARHTFRRYATYGAATAAGVFTNITFGFVRAAILIALWRTQPEIGGYDMRDAITFSFLTQALIAPVAIFGHGLDLPARVRTGDVAIDLYRPVDFQLWWLAGDLGRALFEAAARGLPLVLVGELVFDLRFPSTGWTWLAFVVSVMLAVLVSFALRYLTGLAAFWLLDDAGVRSIVTVSAQFFSGMVLPLVLFPGWFGSVVGFLPFASLVQIPADVFLGQYDGWRILGGLGTQAVWAATLLLAGRVMTASARGKVVVQGG